MFKKDIKNSPRLKIVLIFSILFNIFFILVSSALIFIKSETKQGINYEVNRYSIPLYIKISELFARDYEYKKIAKHIIANEKDDKRIVQTVLDWTDRFIVKDFPESFPIYDDHILNIIIRGYGTRDQRIDVATTLATYAGVKGFWSYLFYNNKRIMVSYFKINGIWYIFEPNLWSFFYTSSGEIATVDDIKTHPEYIKINDTVPVFDGIFLTDYYNNIKFEEPEMIRPFAQMPFKRLKYEVLKFF